MFKINKKIEYALLSLNYMRRKEAGQLTSAKEISSVFNIPFAPTARVLQIMAQNGVLQASQGVHGGYRLKKKLSEISLGDLNNIIAGPIQIASCSKHAGACNLTSLCAMTGSMNALNSKVQNLFNTVILEDFFNQKGLDRAKIT
ncbi:MAG TPA: Rrf2 family transcriptional regulator [Candidatus Omnitrophota bacterium]|jgi:Rrf2 family protein|nr:Rrf2 family transcriptional regulator [Candidatus Omnitrophota bacterium]